MKERKRLYGKKDAWWWTSLTLLWGVFGIFLLFAAGFDIFGALAWGTVFLVPSSIMCMCIKGTQDEEVLEYIIYYFEKWNKKEQIYEPRYIIDRKIIMSEFIFHYHIKDYEYTRSIKELEDYINGFLNDSYSTFEGYRSKKEVMEKIVEEVKSLIMNKKAKENVLVRNVKTLETFTIAEIEKKIESGEFNTDKNK